MTSPNDEWLEWALELLYFVTTMLAMTAVRLKAPCSPVRLGYTVVRSPQNQDAGTANLVPAPPTKRKKKQECINNSLLSMWLEELTMY